LRMAPQTQPSTSRPRSSAPSSRKSTTASCHCLRSCIWWHSWIGVTVRVSFSLSPSPRQAIACVLDPVHVALDLEDKLPCPVLLLVSQFLRRWADTKALHLRWFCISRQRQSRWFGEVPQHAWKHVQCRRHAVLRALHAARSTQQHRPETYAPVAMDCAVNVLLGLDNDVRTTFLHIPTRAQCHKHNGEQQHQLLRRIFSDNGVLDADLWVLSTATAGF